ncbi:RNA-binding S4 domain-containing protein [Thioclava sp. BHET1]|nr:RNA-binding S4 domain-containing protein [Thioclava sp. BHET1]
MRIDKWLWQARFFKTRALAAKVVEGGHVRVNSLRIGKSSVTVAAGDVLTFAQAGRIRVIRVLGVGLRRGPASEAQALFLDLEAGADPTSDGNDPVSDTGRLE